MPTGGARLWPWRRLGGSPGFQAQRLRGDRADALDGGTAVPSPDPVVVGAEQAYRRPVTAYPARHVIVAVRAEAAEVPVDDALDLDPGEGAAELRAPEDVMRMLGDPAALRVGAVRPDLVFRPADTAHHRAVERRERHSTIPCSRSQAFNSSQKACARRSFNASVRPPLPVLNSPMMR